MPADEKGGKPEVQPVAPAPALSPLLAKVIDRLNDAVLEHHTFRGDDRIHIAPERLLEVAKFLRDDPALAFDFLVDVTAVDYLGQPDDFETKLMVWDENRAVVRRRLSFSLDLAVPSAADQMPRDRGRPIDSQPDTAMVVGRLDGTRNLRHVRDQIHRASGLAPHLPLRGIRRTPVAQGLPQTSRATDSALCRTWRKRTSSPQLADAISKTCIRRRCGCSSVRSEEHTP